MCGMFSWFQDMSTFPSAHSNTLHAPSLSLGLLPVSHGLLGTIEHTEPPQRSMCAAFGEGTSRRSILTQKWQRKNCAISQQS